MNRRLVVVGLENLCAEVRVAGDILLFGDDLCGLVRVFLYPLRCLLYGTGEGCCSLRVLLSQLAGDECCAAVLVLVLGIGCGVDESGQTVLLLCNRSCRVAECDCVNGTVLQCLCKIVAGVNREFNLHVLVGHADACRAQRALGDNGCRVSQTGYADLLALEVGNALDVAVTGDEQLGAAGVDAGGELDGQAVFQRLEHFADQAHADINLICTDGLGNVCRVNRYLLNVQTLVLKVAVLDRDVHRCGTERRRVDQTQVGCAGIGGICCRGSVRIAA